MPLQADLGVAVVALCATQVAGQLLEAHQPGDGLVQVAAGENHVAEHLIGARPYPPAHLEPQARVAAGVQNHQEQTHYVQ